MLYSVSKTLYKCCTLSQKPYISVVLLLKTLYISIVLFLKTLYKCCTPSQNQIQMLYSFSKPCTNVVLRLENLI